MFNIPFIFQPIIRIFFLSLSLPASLVFSLFLSPFSSLSLTSGRLLALLSALIKSFNGHSEASYARATRPHRDRICHCDHYGIVGTSSPRDGRRRHCRYSVSGMQMAPPWMVICRLIRPALSRPKTPNYSHSRMERVCRTVCRNPDLVLMTIGSYVNERIGF